MRTFLSSRLSLRAVNRADAMPISDTLIVLHRLRDRLRPGTRSRFAALALGLVAAIGAPVAVVHLTPSAPHHSSVRVGTVAEVNGISNGDACTGPTAFQVTSGQSVTTQVYVGGSAGSTINPVPRVDVLSAPQTLGPVQNEFQAGCRLDIQLLDANGKVVSDHSTGCSVGIQSGDAYAYDGRGADNSPGTGTFTAHAMLTYQATTTVGTADVIDLGTSPAYTAGLHRCIGTGTRGITDGGNPATFSFQAGGEVVVELASAAALGTFVSAALGPDINTGAQSTTGISTADHPYYAAFSQFGKEPMNWTISIDSALGADIPEDKGPAGKGLPGGAGDIAWSVSSDRC